jgi:aerobic-type carbon monoxide dehydrogenase small subunit (CoxS/CutS family)
MIMASVGLLQSNKNPTPAEIIRYLQTNICRCGTYPRVMAAVQDAAARMRGGA